MVELSCSSISRPVKWWLMDWGITFHYLILKVRVTSLPVVTHSPHAEAQRGNFCTQVNGIFLQSQDFSVNVDTCLISDGGSKNNNDQVLFTGLNAEYSQLEARKKIKIIDCHSDNTQRCPTSSDGVRVALWKCPDVRPRELGYPFKCNVFFSNKTKLFQC